MSLPADDQLKTLSFAERKAALGLLFEPCDALVELADPLLQREAEKGTPWPVIIEQIRKALHALSPQDARVTRIVAAHPRLGAKKVDSAQSQAEQASLKSSEAEAAELKIWNDKYETTFPGLRYIVFVAGRPRSEIIVDMQKRINENNYDLEVRRAFDAMCDIALDRQAKLASANSSKI